VPQPCEVSSRKVVDLSRSVGYSPDEWITSYLDLAVIGVRSAGVTGKIRLHLTRFAEYFAAGYGHRRITAVTVREANGWLAHLSGFFTWVAAHRPDLLLHVDQTKKADPPPIPAPMPRALPDAKVWTLKNTVDRIESYHHLTGRRHRGEAPVLHRHARPLRDRAIIFVILGTGLRRAEITAVDLDQVEPRDRSGCAWPARRS
jgi:integrase